MANSKTFIITGASKGIGAAITRQLLQLGHNVVLVARSGDLLADIKKAHPDQVQYLAGDVTNDDLPHRVVELAVSSFNRLDGIVINHGILVTKKFADMTMAEFRQSQEVNLISTAAMAKAGLLELRKTNGCLIWISSGAASGAYQAWTAYGSSKAAMNAVSEHIALEEPSITSVAVAPGRVDTDMQALLRSDGAESMDPKVYDTFVKGHKEGTLLRPEQPGNVIARLVADPKHDLSGKFLRWDAPELASYKDQAN